MPSNWEIDTILQHVLALREADILRTEQRFVAQECAVEAALTTVHAANEKAEKAAEKRYDNLNEWRGAYKDLQVGYITRVEAEAMMTKRQQGDLSLLGAVGVIAAISGVLIGHLWH